MKVVLSQPFFFPWVGMLEQVRLTDVYLHYDDVPFSKGSFENRVQIKTAQGPQWLTAPLQDVHLGTLIRDVRLREDDWRSRHLKTLAQAYAKAPHRDRMLALVEGVYGGGHRFLGELARASLGALVAAFGLKDPATFRDAAELAVPGRNWERVLGIVKAVGGTTYITGWGARNYLDHAAFEKEGVDVAYMAYEKRPYPQLHGPFTPFVSALDLLANAGPEGAACIASGTKPWREFLEALP